jgi:drug/metabolite transporter (DMT)-like permease
MHWTLVAAMAAWGINMSAIKVMTAYFDAVTLAALRMGLAAATMSFIVWRMRLGLPRLSWRQGAALVGCSALLVYGYQVLLVQGLESTTASNASLIVAFTPAAALLLGALYRLRAPGGKRLAGVAAGIAGVAFIVLGRPGAGLGGMHRGDALILLAVLCWAVGGEFIQALAGRMHPMVVAAATHTFGTLLLAVHAALSPAPTVFPGAWSAEPWLLLAFSGIVAAALGNFAWYHSIGRIGAIRTSPAINLVPLFGVGFAVVALSEPLSGSQVLAVGLVVAGSHFAMRPEP